MRRIYTSATADQRRSNDRTGRWPEMASVIKTDSRRDGKVRWEVRWRTPDRKHRTKGGFPRR